MNNHPQHIPDWSRLVSIDFETYYDQDYTLSKLSTSEYIRDPRFKAQMMGIKIGNGKTRIIPHARIQTELAKINWATHSLLCHNTQFDGFILSCHYGVHPAFLYDTLSMARGLHSNDIGAGLDEVSVFYGGKGKLEGLEDTKGVLKWNKELFAKTAAYCANDVDEMFRIFTLMLPKMPDDEIRLIDLTCRMFTSPVLRVDIPRVERELERELLKREQLMYAAVDPEEWQSVLKGKDKLLEGKERDMMIIKKVIGSNDKFVGLLKAEGIEPPIKISPAWMKLDKETRESPEGELKKYAYAFAKDDAKFTELPNMVDEWGLDLNDPEQVKLMIAKQERIQALVDVRLAVKSTTNITRAERFLTAGANGMPLPVGLNYYAAHTGRWGGANKMNCLPGESEVLTPEGWVPLNKFDDATPVAVWNAVSKQITFARVGKVIFGYSGPMVQARTHSGTHDAMYTPDHGIPVTYYRNKNTVVRRTAQELINSSDWLLPVSGEYDNPAPRFTVSPEMARVAAAMQADGGIVPNSPGSNAAQFGFTKPRKIARFRQIFDAAGLRYTETIAGEYTKFYVNHGQAPLAMFKYFNSWLLGLSGEALEALVDEAAYWDGHVRNDSYLYSSATKQNAEWLQTAAHLVGRSAQMQEINNFKGWNTDPDAKLWVVNVKPRSYVINEKDRTPLTLVAYFEGNVYCLTTPTGWFMMRHNGTIHVTGNCQNLVRGGELRLSILAPKGHMLAVADSGQIEARVGAWLWRQDDMVEDFRNTDNGTDRDVYCKFGDHIYGRTITKENKVERFVAKTCIAEGELVLTTRGLVPINLISKEDWLWDGVEWVPHDGVIDQGIKEVITYDGLTATSDHEVFTEDGRIIPFGQAASEMARLQNTGIEGQGIRFCDDHVVADTPRKRLSVRVGADLSVHEGRIYRRADSSYGAHTGSGEMQELARNTHQVRCYDIANAGPRLRFTVSGKLVLNCILGLSFMMGPLKFQATLAKGAIPTYFDLDTCKKIVNIYRSKNHMIVRGWKVCERIIEDMAAGRKGTHGPIHWEKETIWLPNGMALKYPDMRQTLGEKGWMEWSYQSKNMRKKLYSGILAENLAQSLARIIVGWQMLQVAKKYRAVMMTHDEFVCCVTKAQAQKCFELMTKWMQTAPDWCPDLPLASEGGIAENYSK